MISSEESGQRRLNTQKWYVLGFFFKIFIYLFLQRGREGGRGRETSMCGCLWSLLGTCALIGNRTCNPLVLSPVFNPLNHTSKGKVCPVLKENLFSDILAAFLINDQLILTNNQKTEFPKLSEQTFFFKVSFPGEFQ